MGFEYSGFFLGYIVFISDLFGENNSLVGDVEEVVFIDNSLVGIIMLDFYVVCLSLVGDLIEEKILCFV